jgi:hypothetical protein
MLYENHYKDLKNLAQTLVEVDTISQLKEVAKYSIVEKNYHLFLAPHQKTLFSPVVAQQHLI